MRIRRKLTKERSRTSWIWEGCGDCRYDRQFTQKGVAYWVPTTSRHRLWSVRHPFIIPTWRLPSDLSKLLEKGLPPKGLPSNLDPIDVCITGTGGNIHSRVRKIQIDDLPHLKPARHQMFVVMTCTGTRRMGILTDTTFLNIHRSTLARFRIRWLPKSMISWIAFTWINVTLVYWTRTICCDCITWNKKGILIYLLASCLFTSLPLY